MKKAFLIGAVGYPLLEILYRGRTHPSMALAGGLGCVALNQMNRCKLPFAAKALLGGCAITAIEYGIGRVFNRRYQVWDYRNMRGNLQGQICPQFFLVWLGMAAGYAFLAQKNVL